MASTSGSTTSAKSLPGAAIAGVVFGVLFFHSGVREISNQEKEYQEVDMES